MSYQSIPNKKMLHFVEMSPLPLTVLEPVALLRDDKLAPRGLCSGQLTCDARSVSLGFAVTGLVNVVAVTLSV